jgi:hypothetical protein
VITTRRGFRKSTSVSGTLTGLGGNIFIIDDPQKPVDAQSEAQRSSLNEWYANTLLSRLDNKETGVIIVVMQRVHTDDFSGFLAGSSNEWTVLSPPAIAEVPERIQIGPNRFYERGIGEALHPAYESIETLRNLRRTLGDLLDCCDVSPLSSPLSFSPSPFAIGSSKGLAGPVSCRAYVRRTLDGPTPNAWPSRFA